MRVVFLDASTVQHANDVDLSPLEGIGSFQSYETTTPDQLAERLRDAAIVIANKVRLNAELITAHPDLKVIAVAATGTNNVDLDAARRAGVQVCNVRGYSTESVAQHAVAAMLNLATQMHRYTAEPTQWASSPIFTRLDYPVIELQGRTLGLIGVGNIGRRVGEIAQALGMRVIGYARPGSNQEVHAEWPRVPMDALLAESDVVSLHCPLTEETQGLMNAETLRAMKPGAFLINTGRGELVEEAALLTSLREGHLGGAGLDVLSVEPPPANHPLLEAASSLPNLLITPHTAWSSRTARQELIHRVAANIRAFIETGEATNRVA